MSQRTIIALIWMVIFALIGVFFQNLGWSFISWIFYSLAGLSVYTLIVGKK
jgi:hypothetical protein